MASKTHTLALFFEDKFTFVTLILILSTSAIFPALAFILEYEYLDEWTQCALCYLLSA